MHVPQIMVIDELTTKLLQNKTVQFFASQCTMTRGRQPPASAGLPNYRRLPQTTTDQCPCSPQTKENSRKT